jgi:hypothetical protein
MASITFATGTVIPSTWLNDVNSVVYNGIFQYAGLQTANGVAYLNGSKVLTTGSGLQFDGTNLGLGVTPNTWYLNNTVYKAFQFGSSSLFFGNTTASSSNVTLYANAYLDTSAVNRYLYSSYASKYGQSGGAHTWSTAASGTAGNPVSFIDAMTLDASGNLGVGTTSPNASAIIDAQSTTKGVRFPNMTGTQKNAISSPPAGLVVFDTTIAKLCVYSGSAWQTITSI